MSTVKVETRRGGSTVAARRIPRFVTALLWVVVIAVIAITPLLGLDDQTQRQVILTAIMVLLVSGVNLTFGWAGELNMGIPAMYAAGAYVGGYLYIHVLNDVVVGVIAGGLAALLIGIITGVPGLRLGGWVLAIVSFFVVILIPSILQVIPANVVGGSVGLIGIPAPMLFGQPLTSQGFFAFVIVVTGIWFAVYRNIVKSRVGDSLLIVQEGRVLAPSLGLSRYRLKLMAYAVGAIPAGMAGALYASLDRFIGPESFTLQLAINVLAASIIAGRRSIYPIIVGAAFVQFINVRSSDFAQYGLVVFGALLIVGGIAFAGGIAGLGRRLLKLVAPKRFRRGAASTATQSTARTDSDYAFPALPGKLLSVVDVRKTFGGAVALDGVSFEAKPGQITALIGPNGSGKTTMLNIINGFYPVTSGTVSLGERTISSMPSTKVARQGVARTFQTPVVPNGLKAIEVVASGHLASKSVPLIATILRLPFYGRVRRSELEEAHEILVQLGLDQFEQQPGDSLSLGTRRMIELARSLASKPSVVLLDEVASGLDTHEVIELARVLRLVSRAGATVVLVEHNFALVRSLADMVVVLADGAVLTSGPPAEIEKHPEVLRRFLGEMAGLSGTSIVATPSTTAKGK
ncbi:MAG: ATP-binding cassette domain-containing protein [Actinomycetota bacterium]